MTTLDMNRALTPLLLKHTVLLAWPPFYGHPGETQSGFLVTYRGCHLVVTAGHGIEPQMTFPRPVGVLSWQQRFGPLGRHGHFGAFAGSSDEAKVFPPPKGTGEAADLGYVPVDPDHFSGLGMEFLDLTHVQRGWQGNRRHVVAGFPGEFLRSVRPGDEKVVMHLKGGAYLLITDHNDEHYVPSEPLPIHFSLKYRVKGVHSAPEAHGLSGSPVWELDDDATPDNPSCCLTGLVYGVISEPLPGEKERDTIHALRLFVLTDLLDALARDGRLEEFTSLDFEDGFRSSDPL